MTRLIAGIAASLLGAGVVAGCGSPAPEESATSTAKPAFNVDVTLTTDPNPPRMGDNTFEAMVTMDGQPVTEADVSVELFMPAMPEMKMAEMRNTVALKHESGGRYVGSGNVMMAGNWDATVSVKRDGQEIGAKKIPITAK